jgi:hypothetical protein
MTDCWELIISIVLDMLARRELDPVQAESWLWTMTEIAEARET